jgi:Ca2+/Na+ antiporter
MAVMDRDTAMAYVKMVVMAVVSAFAYLTDKLPILILWATFIFTVAQIYFLFRNERRRKRKGARE